MNFSSDLCTLSTLTESTLLSSIQQRSKDQLTESYVGGVLLSMGAPKQSSAPQLFLPSFTSSVLRSLVFSCQDQSILVSGYHTRGNQVLSYQLLSALMEQVEQHPLNLAPSVLLASELLDFLCCSKDECGGAVVVVTVTIRPEVLTLTSAHFSCLLLNTSQLCMYKIFREQGGFLCVEDILSKLGMQRDLIRQLCLILKNIQDLLMGVQAGTVLGETCRTKLPETLPVENSLAQLLYVYLVQWIVLWINSNCFGHKAKGEVEGDCSISVICAPGHNAGDGQQTPAGTSGLPTLITRYANEVFHNLCCSRLFVWEQDQYIEEGIEWDTVEVEFNENLMNAFHQEGGLLEVFELPSVAFMKAGVETCCQLSSSTCFLSGEKGENFTLAHFTGECEYMIDTEWTAANQVHVVGSALRTTLLNSSCDLLVDMAMNMQYSADVLPNMERMTSCKLTQRAKVSMEFVCDLITTSQPHFVFCLKPCKDEPESFNSEFVLSQLQQLKILDIALIQSCGFPVRLKHSHFIKNYETLLVHAQSQTLTDREKCCKILDRANLKEWHVGQTMVMLKPWHLSQLDSALDLFNQSAKKLQRVFRQSISRKKILLPKSMSTDCACPPAPPPRPSHTLPNSQSTASDYDRASSPSHTSPTLHRKKLSWRKSSSHAHQKYVPTSSDLQAHVWFQGRLSREKAEDKLKLVQFDCFLIRESESRVGEFALSLRHSGIIKHFRVDTKHGPSVRYELYGAKRSFPSVEELVDYYSHHCISSGGELLTVPYSIERHANPAPLKRKLSSIRRPKPALATVPVNESRFPRTSTTSSIESSSNHHTPFRGQSLDLSDDSIARLRRELEVEEKIVAAARRMAELPSGNRRERQKRKQSLQQAQSRLLSLRQQFHTIQERKLFIEASMQNSPATGSC